MSGQQQRFTVHVANIDMSVSVEMLKQVFCSCGTILDASLNGRLDAPARYGFIDFAAEESRQRALKYDGYTLVGRKLRVSVSKGNVGRPEASREGHGYGGHASGGGGGYGAGVPGPAPVGANGLSAAEQQQAQFLLQLINQGSVDPTTLTEAQRTLLVAALSGGAVAPSATLAPAAAAASAPMPLQQQQQPMVPMGMYNPYAAMQNPYGGMPYGQPMMPPGMMGPGGYGQPHHMPRQQRPAPNAPPSEELVKRREIQRKQFMKVVLEETEAYEKKLVAKEGGGKSGADESSGSDDDENGDAKKPRVESAATDDGEEATV